MASCNWKKIKTSGEMKAIIRHNDKEAREQTVHANKHIDKTRTKFNMQKYDMSETVKRFDSRHEELEKVPKHNKRKDRVRGISITVPTPKGITDEQKALEWCDDAHKILRSVLLNNDDDEVGMYTHVDEQHEYTDANTEEVEMSRVHLHYMFVPTYTDENGNDKLSADKVMTKPNMIKVNNLIHKMSLERYNTPFMDGTKRKGAEQDHLKRKSAILDAERLETIEEIDNVMKMLQERKEALKRKKEVPAVKEEKQDEEWMKHIGQNAPTVPTFAGNNETPKTVNTQKTETPIFIQNAISDSKSLMADWKALGLGAEYDDDELEI